MDYSIREEVFKEIISRLSDYFIITDLKEKITSLNKPLLNLLKCKKKTLKQKTYKTLFQEKNIVETRKMGKPVIVHVSYTEKQVPYSLHSSLITKDGVPMGVLIVAGATLQTSSLTSALIELRKSFKQQQRVTTTKITLLSDALASVGEGVYVTDIQNRLIYCNKSITDTFGYERFELIGKPPEILHEKPEASRKGEVEAIKKNGQTFPALLTKSPITNKAGKEIGFVGVIRNITEIRILVKKLSEVSDQLRQSVKLKSRELQNSKAQLLQSSKMAAIGTLAAGVAHELNNPLTIITGNCYLLKKDTDCTEKIKKRLARIEEQTERAKKIIHNLSIFARTHKTEKKNINIVDLLDRTLELRSYDLKVKNITVIKEYEEGLPQIYVDEHKIQQVFFNLINNAVDAILSIRESGTLTLNVKQLDKKIKVIVSDDGMGIEPDNIKKIFDPFFTTKDVGQGSGLGLSISYGILSEHKGEIYVESQPAIGTDFIVELPITRKYTGRRGKRFQTSITQPEKAGKILLIDDEEMIVEFTTESLREQGYEVTGVMETKKAIELIKNNNYDLIISDYRMPKLDGKILYNKLKKIKPELTKKLIYITGEIVDRKSISFIKESGLTVLYKPFDVEILLRTVNELVKS